MLKVMIFGTFDHFHPGHTFVVQKALEYGEVFVVVAQDATVRRIKGHLPDQLLEKRMEAVAINFPQTHVLSGDTNNYLVPVRAVEPDIILLGYDQKLPHGVTEDNLGVKIERLKAFEPEKYKSSLRKEVQK